MSIWQDLPQSHPVVLFGSGGLLGSALSQRLPGDTIRIRWSELHDAPAQVRVARVLERLKPGQAYDFIFANGVTDPRAGQEVLQAANLRFPQQIIQATSEVAPHRYLTIGTVHERFTDLAVSNPYLNSKLELGRWMESMAARPDFRLRLLHLRLHTLFSDHPKPHMFLGQMLNSIQKGEVFRMSSGEQVREYHHADFIAQVIERMLSKRWPESPITEISTGQSLRLRDLAQAVFQAFGHPERLEIGALSKPQAEVVVLNHRKSPDWITPPSLDPVEEVIRCLKKGLSS